jgi:hypothetical protein
MNHAILSYFCHGFILLLAIVPSWIARNVFLPERQSRDSISFSPMNSLLEDVIPGVMSKVLNPRPGRYCYERALDATRVHQSAPILRARFNIRDFSKRIQLSNGLLSITGISFFQFFNFFNKRPEFL